MVPISNSWLNQGVNSILKGIEGLELNASGGGGSARYRYVTSARIKLPLQKMTTIIPGTADLVHREVSIRLISGSAVNLEWQGMTDNDYTFLQLNPNAPEYRDNADGGIQLKGYSNIDDCEIAVVIRQQEPITYKLESGGVEVANVGVSLLLQTNVEYSEYVNDWEDVVIIDNLTSSDDYIPGYKVFFINSFTPGERITFNVDASSAGYGGEKVEMQLIKPSELVHFLFFTGINNLLWASFPDFVQRYHGIGRIFTYGGKTALLHRR